jgi:hypothetical protein
VEVTAEEVGLRVEGRGLRLVIVHKTELSFLKNFIVDDQVKTIVVMFRMLVVVAHHQVHGQVRKIVPPFGEQFVFQVGAGVEEITHKDQFAGLEVLDLLEEPLQVFFIYRGRNGYA